MVIAPNLPHGKVFVCTLISRTIFYSSHPSIITTVLHQSICSRPSSVLRLALHQTWHSVTIQNSYAVCSEIIFVLVKFGFCPTIRQSFCFSDVAESSKIRQVTEQAFKIFYLHTALRAKFFPFFNSNVAGEMEASSTTFNSYTVWNY